MKRASAVSILLGLLLSVTTPARGQEVPPFKVDNTKVSKAIEKGVAYLKGRNTDHIKPFKHVKRTMQNCELVLYTYVHADVPEKDAAFKELFKDMMERKIESTYCAALQAMILEEVDRVTYQWRIAQCAQFLVDNQCKNGQWSYGAPTIFAEDFQPTPSRKSVSTSSRKIKRFGSPSAPARRVKPKVKTKIKIVRRREDMKSSGDNSNTQYAALGLRACYDAGMILPKDLLKRAEDWWRESQKDEDVEAEVMKEGGFAGAPKPKPGSRSTRARTIREIKAKPLGWCYTKHAHAAYGSMSAGAIGSIAIYDYIKDNDGGKRASWKKDQDCHEGLVWMAKNFSVLHNPGPYEHGDMAVDSQHQYYYYLYAMERAGMLYGTEIMGEHEWYPEGAKVLLEKQSEKTGAWSGGVRQTCFAILFLKRATAPLDVATRSAAQKR